MSTLESGAVSLPAYPGTRPVQVSETCIDIPGRNPPPASMIVANHTGYMEILYTGAKFGCCFVAKSTLRKMFIMGTIMKCSQAIFVDRASGKSHAGSQIIERAKNPTKWPPLALYPEGTTTNGKQLIKFHTGAFIAGAPVIPLVVKYSSMMFDPAFTCYSTGLHMLQMLAQPINFMHVIQLPTYASYTRQTLQTCLTLMLLCVAAMCRARRKRLTHDCTQTMCASSFLSLASCPCMTWSGLRNSSSNQRTSVKRASPSFARQRRRRLLLVRKMPARARRVAA